MRKVIKYMLTLVLAVAMISFNVKHILFEPPISEGQRVFENVRHEALEGTDGITISNENAQLLLHYISERQTNGEFRVRFGMLLLGLILLIYSIANLAIEYNKRLKHDAQKARAS